MNETEDFDTLIRRSWPMVRSIARDYEIPGMELQDIEQEGLVALMEAARRFSLERGVPFARFANVVVRLRLRDCETKARRHKHDPLNQSVTMLVGEDGPVEALEILADQAPRPEEVAEAREALKNVIHAMNFVLTNAERTAIVGILNGRSYDEIAGDLFVWGSGRRYVDNAVQRGRRKLAAVA